MKMNYILIQILKQLRKFKKIVTQKFLQKDLNAKRGNLTDHKVQIGWVLLILNYYPSSHQGIQMIVIR